MRESPKEPTTSWWCIQRHCCFSLSLCKVNKGENSKKNGEVEKQRMEQKCGVCLNLGHLFIVFSFSLRPFRSVEFLYKKANLHICKCQLVGLSKKENCKGDTQNRMQQIVRKHKNFKFKVNEWPLWHKRKKRVVAIQIYTSQEYNEKE